MCGDCGSIGAGLEHVQPARQVRHATGTRGTAGRAAARRPRRRRSSQASIVVTLQVRSVAAGTAARMGPSARIRRYPPAPCARPPPVQAGCSRPSLAVAVVGRRAAPVLAERRACRRARPRRPARRHRRAGPAGAVASPDRRADRRLALEPVAGGLESPLDVAVAATDDPTTCSSSSRAAASGSCATASSSTTRSSTSRAVVDRRRRAGPAGPRVPPGLPDRPRGSSSTTRTLDGNTGRRLVRDDRRRPRSPPTPTAR